MGVENVDQRSRPKCPVVEVDIDYDLLIASRVIRKPENEGVVVEAAQHLGGCAVAQQLAQSSRTHETLQSPDMQS